MRRLSRAVVLVTVRKTPVGGGSSFTPEEVREGKQQEERERKSPAGVKWSGHPFVEQLIGTVQPRS